MHKALYYILEELVLNLFYSEWLQLYECMFLALSQLLHIFQWIIYNLFLLITV